MPQETGEGWDRDRVSSLAAALAFYTLLSLAPLLVIAIAIAGFVLGEDAARHRIGDELGTVVGGEAARAIEEVVKGARAPAAGIVSTVIGLYLGKSTISSAYGAAGSLVVLVIWVYYSAQILLLGAEFTQAYARRFGSRVTPAENAVPADAPEPGAPKSVPLDA